MNKTHHGISLDDKSMNETKVKESYDKEPLLWNDVYSEYEPADLRNIKITVEPGFDGVLREFGEKSNYVLDFGCGTGDIIFQYMQYFPENIGVGIDESEKGISFATKTTALSHYKNLRFSTGDLSALDNFQDEEFKGIILSNVLDVMPEQLDELILQKLNRVLSKDGYWFIKLNPYYTAKEIHDLDYIKEAPHLYEEDGILRLHQETTDHWKRIFTKYGCIQRYMEFEYPWQEGLNRLFLIKKDSSLGF